MSVREAASGHLLGSRCAKTKRENDEAKNAITDASHALDTEGLRIGGGLGLAFALAYGCLYAMRVGLLSRFWGSLGIALGVAAALGLFQFALIWFIYFGLLAAGWLPRRPPARLGGRRSDALADPGEKAAERWPLPRRMSSRTAARNRRSCPRARGRGDAASARQPARPRSASSATAASSEAQPSGFRPGGASVPARVRPGLACAGCGSR